MSASSRPTRPFRVGVQLQPQHATYAEIRHAVEAAEDAGVDIVFNWDHFYPLSGPSDGPNFECWSMLAAWAGAAPSTVPPATMVAARMMVAILVRMLLPQ